MYFKPIPFCYLGSTDILSTCIQFNLLIAVFEPGSQTFTKLLFHITTEPSSPEYVISQSMWECKHFPTQLWIYLKKQKKHTIN